jgi:TetR/AcrR family transcriptional regulator, transcriptional repressor for nem operon
MCYLIIQLSRMPTPLPASVPDTRSRIVEAARALFWEKGYAATGLAEILARGRANSGSFYHFFDSKDALLCTVLDSYVELLEPQVIGPVWASTADPLDRVFALLAAYRQRLLDTNCQYGCPIGRLALEIDPENTPAHAHIARNFSAWKAAVEACLRAAGVPRPKQGAAMTLAVMEGAVMQARAHRDVEPFDACIQQLREYFRAVTPARRPRRPASHTRTR